MPTSAFNQPPKPEIVRYLSMVLALPSENRGQIGKSQPSDKNNSEEQKLWEQFEAVEALPLCGRQTPGATSQCRQRKKSAKVEEKKYLGEHHILLCFDRLSFTLHISFVCESIQRVSQDNFKSFNPTGITLWLWQYEVHTDTVNVSVLLASPKIMLMEAQMTHKAGPCVVPVAKHSASFRHCYHLKTEL